MKRRKAKVLMKRASEFWRHNFLAIWLAVNTETQSANIDESRKHMWTQFRYINNELGGFTIYAEWVFTNSAMPSPYSKLIVICF